MAHDRLVALPNIRETAHGGISAPSVFGDEQTSRDARQQLGNLSRRVRPVKRWIASVSFTRAREQRDNRFNIVRHPNRNAVYGPESLRTPRLADAVNPAQELFPGKPPPTILHSDRIEATARMLSQQRIERVRPPQPTLVELRRSGRVMKG